jgi:hypothetical protein
MILMAYHSFPFLRFPSLLCKDPILFSSLPFPLFSFLFFSFLCYLKVLPHNDLFMDPEASAEVEGDEPGGAGQDDLVAAEAPHLLQAMVYEAEPYPLPPIYGIDDHVLYVAYGPSTMGYVLPQHEGSRSYDLPILLVYPYALVP